MLFYSIELLHIHITCLHVYYCLHIPSSPAQDARLCHGRGKDSRKLWRYPNSSSRLGFHGFGVAHAKGGLEVALPPNASPPALRHAAPQRTRTQQGQCRVPGPNASTRTPTANWQRTPAACPKDWQQREGERLIPDAPDDGARRPPGDALLPPPKRATPARKTSRGGAVARPPHPHNPRPAYMGNRAQPPAPRVGIWKRESA